MIFRLFKSGARRKQAETVYLAIASGSREPRLYLDCGVPDTVEGRFESLGLHVSLVLRRLKSLPPPALDLSKDLIDLFFQDLDSALRELGVGDLSVGKKIKKLAEAFYGRAKVLETTLAHPDADGELEGVLTRNVIGVSNADVPEAQALASYVRRCVENLDRQDLQALIGANRLFVAPVPLELSK